MIFRNFNCHFVVLGHSEGREKIAAFDGALLAAGIGNFNLLKVSSILPPGSEFLESKNGNLPVAIAEGTVVPIAYEYFYSDIYGETIAASVALAYPYSSTQCGLIIECAGIGTKAEYKKLAIMLAEDAMDKRERKIDKILTFSTDRVVKNKAAVFAGAVLWNR